LVFVCNEKIPRLPIALLVWLKRANFSAASDSFPCLKGFFLSYSAARTDDDRG
jgi:hypothetical protein